MARYQPTVAIWSLDDTARAALQPGQWIRCGDSAHLSRFYRQGAASTLAFHGTAPHATRKMLSFIQSGKEAAQRKESNHAHRIG